MSNLCCGVWYEDVINNCPRNAPVLFIHTEWETPSVMSFDPVYGIWVFEDYPEEGIGNTQEDLEGVRFAIIPAWKD